MLSKAKYDSSPARPIHRSRQGCRRIPATHSPYPLRQGNQVPPTAPASAHLRSNGNKQARQISPSRHAHRTRKKNHIPTAARCDDQRTALQSPTQRAATANAPHYVFFPSLFESPLSTFHFALFTLNFPKGQLFTLNFSLLTSQRDHFSLFTFHTSLPAGTTFHSSLFTFNFPQKPSRGDTFAVPPLPGICDV